MSWAKDHGCFDDEDWLESAAGLGGYHDAHQTVHTHTRAGTCTHKELHTYKHIHANTHTNAYTIHAKSYACTNVLTC